MKKIFFNPLKIILVLIIVEGIGIFSGVATLTNFNIVDWFKQNYPKSLFYFLLSLVIIYLILVVIGFLKQNRVNVESTTSTPTNNKGVTQIVNSQKIESTTIKMAGRDLNEHNKEN